MAFSEMSLPIDIPWKRMGVSRDMIDLRAGDLKFPGKWQSSIAVFYHEPPELPPEYCNRKITYLKVICTITNYQTDAVVDVTILDKLRETHSEYYGTWEPFYYLNQFIETQSWPCFGALLQVAVFPHPGRRPDGALHALHDFPYISSFQPRKREMYEAVAESGEVASQSSNRINVLKGSTNTDTNEDYNLDLGGGTGGHSGVFGLWNEQHTDPNVQKGSIGRYQKQDQNVTTSDASREKRESHAYSTNINQLYTLLQSYHLGTNRAMFFMQPRPHVQDIKFSFVQGLRRLEGIQEFFLIVNRPATVPGLCVEIALETAHAILKRAYKPRIIPLHELYMSGNLNKTASALGIAEGSFDEMSWVDIWNKSGNWERSLATSFKEQRIGWAELTPHFNNPESGITRDLILTLVEVLNHLPDIGLENVALIFAEYQEDQNWFS